ncbi:MAG: hypothetical protein Q8O57_05145 [Kiritimatiellota bacterium]|nr:hypothetical protein [Kiritimatiellota bacterium]
MTKIELLHQIQEGIKGEESATAIYLKHLSAMMTRSALAAADITRAKRLLRHLIAMNRRHKAILTQLANRINQEPDHDY